MSLSFLNPLTFGIMLVVAVGTVAYNIWSTKQQHSNYGHSRPNTNFDFDYDIRSTSSRNTAGPYTDITRCSKNTKGQATDNKKRRKENVEDDTCSICLEKLREGLKTLHCDHIFHYKCITKWLDSNQSCPLCRHAQ